MAVSSSVGFNHLPQIAKRLKPAVQEIISEAAILIEASASSGAPFRSGFLAGSVYSVTPKWGSTYGSAVVSPPGDSYLLPEETPPNDTSAIVAVAANYGVYVEFGTRFMAAQPFFYQAVEDGAAYLDSVNFEDKLRV